jgi:excisionase family DNA binding protein
MSAAFPLTLALSHMNVLLSILVGLFVRMLGMKIGDEEVLTVNQAAERIGISPDTLQSQIRRGKIPAQRFGRQWMLTAPAIRQYIEERKGKHGFAAESHPFHGQRPPRKGESGEH